MKPECKVQKRADESGSKLPEYQADKERQRRAVAGETAVAEYEDLKKPAYQDRQPQPKHHADSKHPKVRNYAKRK